MGGEILLLDLWYHRSARYCRRYQGKFLVLCRTRYQRSLLILVGEEVVKEMTESLMERGCDQRMREGAVGIVEFRNPG